MKKIFLSLFFSLIFSVAFGQLSQFRMIGSGSWSTVNDSTFSSTVTIQSDLTANGFLPTGITDSMYIFTQTGQRYRISSAINLTFSSADLSIVERGGDWGVPVGQVMIYEDNERTAVPSIPFGATGATAKMQEAIDSYNSSVIGSGGASSFTALSDSPSSYTGQANKMVLVNPGESGLIFVDTAGIGTGGVIPTSFAADSITVTPTGNLDSTNVQGALEELQSDIDALAISGISDGDKGDITVSSGVWSIDQDAEVLTAETTRTRTYSSNGNTGIYWGDYENHINANERFPLSVTVGTNGAGTVRLAYLIFDGATAVVRKTTDHVVSTGNNTITVDTTGLSLSDTTMYIALEKVSGNVVAYTSISPNGNAYFINTGTLAITNTTSYEFNYSVKWRHGTGVLKGIHDLQTVVDDAVLEVDDKIDSIAAYTGRYPAGTVFSHTYINTLLSTYDVVTLPEDTITITGSILIPEGKTLRGLGAKSVLKTTTSSINCISIYASGITLENFTILGNGALDFTSSSLINSHANIEARNGIGNQVGIYITGTYEIAINGVRAHDLTGAALRVNNSVGSTLFRGAVSVSNCQFTKNYIGIDFYSTGEYNNVTNCRINQNIIGVWSEAGNNYYSNCIITANRVGLVCGGRATEGTNNSHSSMSNTSLNHSEFIAIYGFDFDFGFFFSNCQIWGTASGDGVVMNDCLGFSWIGGFISRDISFLGSGSGFISHARHSSANTITTSGTATYDGKNNSELDGTVSGSMNN